MKAIETTGVIDGQHRLQLDRRLPDLGRNRVRVIILLPESEDIEDQTWLQAAADNPAFDSLKESTEDVYTPQDGTPFQA